MRKNIEHIILFLFLSLYLGAQDIHYSQYFFSPVQQNPALTGVFDGKFRASVAYRDQWSSLLGTEAFQTMKIDAEYKIPFRKNDMIAFGISMVNDEVGANRYRQSLGHMTVSYHKKLFDAPYSSNTHYLVGGLRAGVGQNSLAWSDLWFGRQYDIASESINTSLPTGENFNDLASETYPDLGVGLMWYATMDKNSIYAGASMDHINEPNISLINQNAVLYQKLGFYIGGSINLTEGSYILPSLLVNSQGPYRQINFGSQLRFSRYAWDDVAVRIGLFGRYVKRLEGNQLDAIILTSGFEMGKFTLGLSYDVTVSALQGYNSRKGAFELSIIYVNSEFKRRKKLICPKF